MTNPYIAATYERIAKYGTADFYKGDIARQIAAFSEANGGLLKMKDLQDHRSTWVDPVSTTYRGYEVWELPPNGQGIAVLEILNLLEQFDVKGMGHNSTEFLHLYIEAKKLAYADRARFYADPEFAKDLPIRQLISKGYAAIQKKRIDLQRAALEVPPGDPRLNPRRHHLHHRGRQGSQLCLADFRAFPRLGLRPGAGRSGLRPAGPRHALQPRPEASQSP